MVSKPPVFIIGNPRSGTTLLRLMLTCHPTIVVAPEGGFLIQLFNDFHHFSGDPKQIDRFVDRLMVVPKMEFWKIEPNELRTFLQKIAPHSYAQLAAGVYRYYSLQQGKANAIWGDKNNFYLQHIPKLVRLFPEAWFIHIVRDGRDVACSYRNLVGIEGRYAPQLPTSLLEIAAQWQDNLTMIEAGLRLVPSTQVHVVRYEDILTNTEEQLRQITYFLGKSYSNEMLSFWEHNRVNNLEPEAFDSWKWRDRQPLDSSRAGRWRYEMFPEDLEIFHAVAGRSLAKYSYECPRASKFNIIRFTSRCRHSMLSARRLPKHAMSRIKGLISPISMPVLRVVQAGTEKITKKLRSGTENEV